MAKLIDPIRLIEKPKNTPMFIECRGEEELPFKVAWKYNEETHRVSMVGRGAVYDIDGYNRWWRGWDELPTAKERKNTPWLPEEAQ